MTALLLTQTWVADSVVFQFVNTRIRLMRRELRPGLELEMITTDPAFVICTSSPAPGTASFVHVDACDQSPVVVARDAKSAARALPPNSVSTRTTRSRPI
jgi:hypothetical protein